MSYEYKESIISDLVDMLEVPSGVWRYTQKLNELHEVYAKAQAFDEVLKSYDESFSNSHLGDEIIGIIQKYVESNEKQ